LSGGNAYSHASKEFINSFDGPLRDEVISVFSDSLKAVWQGAVGVVGLAFLLSFLEKEIKSREELDTEYGLTDKDRSGPGVLAE
jgi:hypothetical protein